ncbi:MAG: phosphoribosyltransferase [Robiginitomaculum sp.]|nr:MAG: phosphoribosyltransferase [Robiginitomaculum sp.]
MGIKKDTSLDFSNLAIIGGAKIVQSYHTVLNSALPVHSLITGLPLGGDDAELWQKLQFLDTPCCALCGYPFEYDPNMGEGGDSYCAPCHARPPKYDRGRSAILYCDASRKIILDFKHGGRTDGLAFFGAQLLRVGREFLKDADVILPVPLHKARLRSRKFNQSALLAGKLSQLSHIPYDTNALLRIKNTPSQSGQTFVGRKRNVVGAFHVPASQVKHITGARIILIDDVLTSGATLEGCARVLKRAGAAQVDVLTLMRVVSPLSVPT